MLRSLFLENEIDGQNQEHEGDGMVPAERFGFEKEQGEESENAERDDLLDDFELEEREWASVFPESDPVGRNQQNVFEEGDTPAEQDHAELRQIVEPFLSL